MGGVALDGVAAKYDRAALTRYLAMPKPPMPPSATMKRATRSPRFCSIGPQAAPGHVGAALRDKSRLKPI